MQVQKFILMTLKLESLKMKTKFLIGLLLAAIILISGCVEKECETGADCLAKDCQKADCVNSKCSYSAVPDCCGNEICEVGETYPGCAADYPNCDDANECTVDDYDYHEQECISEPVTPCCGNDICDKDSEDYSSCPGDCPNCDDKNDCTVDEYDHYKQECVNTPVLDVICCGNGACEMGEDYESCARDCPNCADDNECTEDSYDYHELECVNEVIIPCCGNEICDEGVEDGSSCPADCPDCDDGNRLTTDTFNYATQACESVVTHYFIDDFEGDTKNWGFSGEGTWSTAVEEGNTVLKLGWVQANLKTEWENYALKYRFKRVAGSMHANFRHSEPKEGWNRYFVGVSQWGVGALHKQVGDDFQTLKDIGFEIDEGWHTIEIKCYDNIIVVYLDDELIRKYKDTSDPLLSGRVGIEIHTGGEDVQPEFLIDDVEVKVLAEGEVVYP